MFQAFGSVVSGMVQFPSSSAIGQFDFRRLGYLREIRNFVGRQLKLQYCDNMCSLSPRHRVIYDVLSPVSCTSCSRNFVDNYYLNEDNLVKWLHLTTWENLQCQPTRPNRITSLPRELAYQLSGLVAVDSTSVSYTHLKTWVSFTLLTYRQVGFTFEMCIQHKHVEGLPKVKLPSVCNISAYKVSWFQNLGQKLPCLLESLAMEAHQSIVQSLRNHGRRALLQKS